MVPAACNKGAGGIRDMCTAVHVCIGGPLAHLFWFLLVPLQARTRHLTVCSQQVVCKEAYLQFTIKPAASSYRSWNAHSGFPRIDATQTNEAACGWEET